MATHELKTWPEPFEAVWRDRKRYEIRKNDRGFAVGDVLVLHEWRPRLHGVFPQTVGMDGNAHYTGRVIRTEVEYMTDGGAWGLPAGLCVMSIRTIRKEAP